MDNFGRRRLEKFGTWPEKRFAAPGLTRTRISTLRESEPKQSPSFFFPFSFSPKITNKTGGTSPLCASLHNIDLSAAGGENRKKKKMKKKKYGDRLHSNAIARGRRRRRTLHHFRRAHSPPPSGQHNYATHGRAQSRYPVWSKASGRLINVGWQTQFIRPERRVFNAQTPHGRPRRARTIPFLVHFLRPRN